MLLKVSAKPLSAATQTLTSDEKRDVGKHIGGPAFRWDGLVPKVPRILALRENKDGAQHIDQVHRYDDEPEDVDEPTLDDNAQ